MFIHLTTRVVSQRLLKCPGCSRFLCYNSAAFSKVAYLRYLFCWVCMSHHKRPFPSPPLALARAPVPLLEAFGIGIRDPAEPSGFCANLAWAHGKECKLRERRGTDTIKMRRGYGALTLYVLPVVF